MLPEKHHRTSILGTIPLRAQELRGLSLRLTLTAPAPGHTACGHHSHLTGVCPVSSEAWASCLYSGSHRSSTQGNCAHDQVGGSLQPFTVSQANVQCMWATVIATFTRSHKTTFNSYLWNAPGARRCAPLKTDTLCALWGLEPTWEAYIEQTDTKV